MFSFSAIRHTTILLLAMLFMAGAWSIGRLPGAKLLMVAFTFLASVRLADIRNFRKRLQLALTMASCASAAQFLLSVSWQLPLLQLLLSTAFSFFVFSTLPDRRDGCIVLITGYLALSAQPGWFPAISRSIDIFTGLFVIMAVTSFGNAGQTGKKEVQPLPCSTHQALILATELGIGTLLFRLLQLKQGAWIMLTILFTVMSETPETSGEKLSLQRIAAVPAGIIAGGFLLETFFRMDYRLFYLIPFIGAAGFFILYNYGDYFLFSVIFMVTLTLFSDWMAGEYHRFHFWESFFSRSVPTLLGGLLELFMYKYHRPEKGAAA